MTQSSKSALITILTLAIIPSAVPIDYFILTTVQSSTFLDYNGPIAMFWGIIYADTQDIFYFWFPLVCYCGAAASAAGGVFIERENTRITTVLLTVLGVLPPLLFQINSEKISFPVGTIVVFLIIWNFYPSWIPYMSKTPHLGSERPSGRSSGSRQPEDDSQSLDQFSVDSLREQADAALKTAETARENKNYNQAAAAYEEALSKYQAALNEPPDGQANPRNELEEAVELARQRLDKVTTKLEDQRTVTKSLQPAERSLREAIVAYVEDDQTVARIRFRQARDSFEEAREIIAEREGSLLTDPIEMAVQPDRKLSSMTLSEFAAIPEAVAAALSDAGIEKIDDLDSSTEPPWTPAAVEELVSNDTIEEDVATTLTLLSWWQDDDSYEFETAEAIEKRQQQANYGFNHSS